MENVLPVENQVIARQPTRSVLAVRLEVIAYLVLFALALAFRLVELDVVPMQADEARQALAAWRVVFPDAVGEAIVPSSPILFALQSLSFSLIGGNELAARLLTALAGAALVLMPILFRPALGATRALIISLMLAFSPVALIASRFSSPTIWSMVFAALALWGLWHDRQARSVGADSAWGRIAAACAAGALIFLSEPGGTILALILTGALAAARFLTRRAELFAFESDEPAQAQTPERTFAQAWGMPLFVAALVVGITATGMLLYPAGLSVVGEVIAGAVRGFVQPTPNSVYPYPLVVSLFYEPVTWLLAITGFVVLYRRDGFTFVDRFFAAWLLLGVLASLLFVGARADHALWLIAPLIGLASASVVHMIAPEGRQKVFAAPYSARWVAALATLAVIAVFTLSFQSFARSLQLTADGALATFTPQPNSVVLVIVSLLFAVIGFFLFASLWDNRTALRGAGLGLLIFGLITSLGRGWTASVFGAANPVELWHLNTTHADTALLRQTLLTVAERESGGFPVLPVTVVAEQDGVIAWLLRDFTAVEYVSNAGQAATDSVVLLPFSDDLPPLQMSYVGQDFTVERAWTPASMYATDIPGWWTQLQTRSPWTSAVAYVLWLRQDIYQGVPLETPGVG